MILWELFLAFFQIGLFLIGGGYAAIPLIQSNIVEQHAWLSMSEFADLISIAEMTPGPIAINAATFVGIRVGGIGGALTASLGCITPTLLITTLVFSLYRKYRMLPFLQCILRTLRPIVVGVIASAGLSLLKTALFHGAPITADAADWLSFILFAAAFVILRWKKWNPILIMTACGTAYLCLHLLFP